MRCMVSKGEYLTSALAAISFAPNNSPKNELPKSAQKRAPKEIWETWKHLRRVGGNGFFLRSHLTFVDRFLSKI